MEFGRERVTDQGQVQVEKRRLNWGSGLDVLWRGGRALKMLKWREQAGREKKVAAMEGQQKSAH